MFRTFDFETLFSNIYKMLSTYRGENNEKSPDSSKNQLC